MKRKNTSPAPAGHPLKRGIIALLMAATLGSTPLAAQTNDADGTADRRLSLRTNLVLWAAGSPHIGVDYAFGSRWQAGIDASYGDWDLGHDVRTARLTTAGAQIRRYFRPFDTGHTGRGAYTSPSRGAYLGADVRYTKFNDQLFSDKGTGREGDLVTAGIVAGYSFALDRRGHWAVDTAIGAGFVHRDYDRYAWYAPAGMNRRTGSAIKNGFGVTTVEAALVYRF